MNDTKTGRNGDVNIFYIEKGWDKDYDENIWYSNYEIIEVILLFRDEGVADVLSTEMSCGGKWNTWAGGG